MKYGNMSVEVANKYVLEALRYVGYDYSFNANIETRIVKEHITKKKVINQKNVRKRFAKRAVLHIIHDSKIEGEKVRGCYTKITDELYLEMLKFGMELNDYTVHRIDKVFYNGKLSYYVRAMLIKDNNVKRKKKELNK